MGKTNFNSIMMNRMSVVWWCDGMWFAVTSQIHVYVLCILMRHQLKLLCIYNWLLYCAKCFYFIYSFKRDEKNMNFQRERWAKCWKRILHNPSYWMEMRSFSKPDILRRSEWTIKMIIVSVQIVWIKRYTFEMLMWLLQYINLKVNLMIKKATLSNFIQNGKFWKKKEKNGNSNRGSSSSSLSCIP